MYKKVLSGLALILIAAPALATIPVFAEIDTDEDGSISKSEAITAGISQRLFAKLDLDMDNKLSTDEYKVLTKDQG
jgi:hypothetical protein